jgi:hypothetical protein
MVTRLTWITIQERTTTQKMITITMTVDATIIAIVTVVITSLRSVTYILQLLRLGSGHVAMFGRRISVKVFTAWKSAKFGKCTTSTTQDA